MNSISVQHVGKDFSRAGYPRHSPFVALQDVSFDAQPGEILGVLGRNGAGKSTLLKILARILRPSRGRIELTGRVGSLLEVGTGFHPDLSGRENIFLNAAILGMSRAEVLKRFDAIVAFAGFEQHLDEPVKHYSSGMYMRLAFAVAAHVEPEIFLMDEVLAVGDIDFQRKCLERVQQVGRNGQTVVFVSHNVQAVLRLCTRALLLEDGRVHTLGDVREVAAAYLELFGPTSAERSFPEPARAPGDRSARLRRVRVVSLLGHTLPALDIADPFGIELEFDLLAPGLAVFPSLLLHNEWGPICWATDAGTPSHGRARPAGNFRATAWFPANLLSPGRITVTASLLSFSPHTVHFEEQEVVAFQALETQQPGSRGDFLGHIDGPIRPLLSWDIDHRPLKA